MTFTFPLDASGNAGAVHSTVSGTDFYVPTREQGSEQLIGDIQTVSASNVATQLQNNPCREVTLIGLSGNQSSVYVGGSNVTSSIYGCALNPNDSITLRLSNTNLIYISSLQSGNGVSYVAI